MHAGQYAAKAGAGGSGIPRPERGAALPFLRRARSRAQRVVDPRLAYPSSAVKRPPGKMVSYFGLKDSGAGRVTPGTSPPHMKKIDLPPSLSSRSTVYLTAQIYRLNEAVKAAIPER